MKNDELRYEIVRELGVLSTRASKWQKVISFVKWNENPAKIDIREWSEDRQKMNRGITLTESEAIKLRDCLIAEFGCVEPEIGNEKTDAQIIDEIKYRLCTLLERDPGENELDEEEVNDFYADVKNLYESIKRLGY